MIYTENEAKAYAEIASQHVVIRTIEAGCSKDTRRKAKKAEAKLVYAAIFAALLAAKNGENKQAAKNTVEYFFNLLCGDKSINAYDSVYLSIDRFFASHE